MYTLQTSTLGFGKAIHSVLDSHLVEKLLIEQGVPDVNASRWVLLVHISLSEG